MCNTFILYIEEQLDIDVQPILQDIRSSVVAETKMYPKI